MAGSQKSQDIDVLSVRKIYAKGDNNTTIPANSFLGTDGIGGTRWVDISTIKNGITFNTFTTTQSTFTSGPGTSRFSILDGNNVGLTPFGPGNSVQLYSKSFGNIDVIGQGSISAYDPITGTINDNIQLAGTGVINISTDTTNNLINIYSPNDATSSMSTVVGNFTSLNSFFTNKITTFQSPFSTFIYSAISSFSTSQGTSISKQLATQTLNTSTINMLGSRQPFLQYGYETINSAGFDLVTLKTPYSNSTYGIQLTYLKGPSKPIIPLSFDSVNRNTFRVYGDVNTAYSWTTHGDVF
jgi:hypothetical protein